MLLKFVFQTTKTARSREKLLSEAKEESNPGRRTASEIDGLFTVKLILFKEGEVV